MTIPIWQPMQKREEKMSLPNISLPSWMDHERGDYARLADELIDRIGKVEAIDRDHLRGVREIRDRLNKYLADLHDFDRSGVTG